MMSAVTELVLVLVLASLQTVVFSAVDDGTRQSQLYNNVFFRDPPHMKGRPSTSFVMVKSDDGREYHVANSGHSWSVSPWSAAVSPLSPQCTPMVPKPASMCVGASDQCSNVGGEDPSCPDFGLCCFNGCAATCMPRDQVTREYEARVARLAVTGQTTCPVLESKTEAACANATASCWSRGVPDVDCEGFGLCCFDGCVNTCLKETETETEQPDYEFDQTLSQYDEDEDEELDEELDDELGDDLLDDDIDSYGAPAAPVLDIDTYGSPLADTISLDSYGSPKAQPFTGYKSVSEPSYKLSRTNSLPPQNEAIINLGNCQSLCSIHQGKSSNQIQPSYYTASGFYPVRNPSKESQHGIQRNPKHLKFSHKQHIPKQVSSKSVFHHKQPQLSRKKLFLNKHKSQNVLSTLEKFWRKHFGVFANF